MKTVIFKHCVFVSVVCSLFSWRPKEFWLNAALLWTVKETHLQSPIRQLVFQKFYSFNVLESLMQVYFFFFLLF